MSCVIYFSDNEQNLLIDIVNNEKEKEFKSLPNSNNAIKFNQLFRILEKLKSKRTNE